MGNCGGLGGGYRENGAAVTVRMLDIRYLGRMEIYHIHRNPGHGIGKALAIVGLVNRRREQLFSVDVKGIQKILDESRFLVRERRVWLTSVVFIYGRHIH